MKKWYASFLPVLLLVLSGCSFNFGNLHVDVVTGDGSGDEIGDDEPRVVEYYEGDSVSSSDYNHSLVINVSNDNTKDGSDSLESSDVLALLNKNGDAVNSVTDFANVNDGVGGLKIGSSGIDDDGTLTFLIKDSITASAVVISSYPRYSDVFDYDTGKIVTTIDEAAISVNDSKFIKLSSSEKAVASTCSYLLSSTSNSIKIDVYNKRAIIKNITLLYN